MGAFLSYFWSKEADTSTNEVEMDYHYIVDFEQPNYNPLKINNSNEPYI